MSEFYHTIVVGAGPAGLTAARYLDGALVLEAKRRIGHPVRCAEGLSAHGLAALGIDPDPAFIAATMRRTEMVLPGGAMLAMDGEGYILDREPFEQALAARVRGPVLLDTPVRAISRVGSRWQVETDGATFQSSYLIGADGPRSPVARQVFGMQIPTDVAREYLVRLTGARGRPFDPAAFRIYLSPSMAGELGYGWVFPKSATVANVGIIHREARGFERFLDAVRDEYGPFERLEARNGIAPRGGGLPEMARHGALLAGDAGNLTDPIFRGGIYAAMASGKLAAEAILSGDPASYPRRLRQAGLGAARAVRAAQRLYAIPEAPLGRIGRTLAGVDLMRVSALPPRSWAALGPRRMAILSTTPADSLRIYAFARHFREHGEYIW